tara:strand:+ start:6329 stop:7333 length:1005 start_codon:yes stop_codon:yes gene_type:complete
MIYFYTTLLVVFLLTVLLINLYLKISLKRKILDKALNYNMHKKDTPTGSGIVFLIMYLIFLIIIRFLEINQIIEIVYPNRFYIFNLSLIFLSIISFYDDIKNLHPNIRFFFQILFVSISLSLINFQLLTNYLPLKILIIFVTFYWVYQINCTNFIDGLDGFLITHSLFLAFNSFIYFFYFDNDNFLYFFSLFLLVICSAFLLFNKPKAKIFMGDSGSIFIGYGVGFISLFFLSILRIDIMISLICYPFIDCTLTIINKMLKKKYPWERLFDYNFLKPVKLYGKSHSYVLKYFIYYNIGLSINIFLQIVFNYKYLFIVSIIYTVILIIFFNRKIK